MECETVTLSGAQMACLRKLHDKLRARSPARIDAGIGVSAATLRALERVGVLTVEKRKQTAVSYRASPLGVDLIAALFDDA